MIIRNKESNYTKMIRARIESGLEIKKAHITRMNGSWGFWVNHRGCSIEFNKNFDFVENLNKKDGNNDS